MEVDSPPRPPSAYTPPPRPTESFTPPPPPTQILGLGKAAAPPQAPILLPPPPPPPAASDSGGEASMSSISDTDLGEVSHICYCLRKYENYHFRYLLLNQGGISPKSLPQFLCPPPLPHPQVCSTFNMILKSEKSKLDPNHDGEHDFNPLLTSTCSATICHPTPTWRSI